MIKGTTKMIFPLQIDTILRNSDGRWDRYNMRCVYIEKRRPSCSGPSKFSTGVAEHVERTNSIMDNLTAPRENLKFTLEQRARDVVIGDSVIISLA